VPSFSSSTFEIGNERELQQTEPRLSNGHHHEGKGRRTTVSLYENGRPYEETLFVADGKVGAQVSPHGFCCIPLMTSFSIATESRRENDSAS
jgi:hypothetical protein